MYIVAIAWMYVVVLMAATQPTVLSALSTLMFYGIVPCSVVMYIIMAPSRKRRKNALERAEQLTNQANLTKPESQTDL